MLDFEMKTGAGTATIRSAPTSVGAKISQDSRAASCSRSEMKDTIDILDVVAITGDLPERGLYR
jgi:hypothetical protein